MLERLATFLHVNRVAIATRWLEKVRVSEPGEAQLTRTQTLDSLHIFLDEVARSLRARTVCDPGSRCGTPVAREHGRQRQGLRTGVPQLVAEYGLCFEAIVEVAGERGEALAVDASTALARCLFAAAAAAVDEYVEREIERQRSSDAEHFAFIAHELRGPLQAMRLAVDLQRDGFRPERSAVLGRRIEHAAELLDQAIRGASATSFAGQLHVEELSVLALVQDSIDECAMVAESRGVRLGMEIGPALVVAGDRRLLRSVLVNLVDNGARYTRLGSAVVVRALVAEGRLLIEVRDQCGGLRGGDIDRMFRAFQVGDDRRRGLSLALSKEAVEAHGGTLNIANDEGVGCRFTVDLLLRQTTA